MGYVVHSVSFNIVSSELRRICHLSQEISSNAAEKKDSETNKLHAFPIQSKQWLYCVAGVKYPKPAPRQCLKHQNNFFSFQIDFRIIMKFFQMSAHFFILRSQKTTYQSHFHVLRE